MKDGLTTKQRRFVEEYCACFNATQSAIKAGYAERSAQEIGSENLSKPIISDAIAARLKEMAMTSDEATKRLTDIARGSFVPFLVISEDGKITIDLSSPMAQQNLHLIKKIRQVTKKVGNGENAIEVVNFEIELHDAKDALKMILEVHQKIGANGHDVDIEITVEA